MTSIVVVGSVALDTLTTPFGSARDVLGGSAVYFSLAARHYAPIKLVAVVGEDFPSAHVGLLQQHDVDLRGLQIVPGRTFRWVGKYDFDLNVAHTIDTQLNVFAEFHPHLPEDYRQADVVFLANIDPSLQLEVLEQIPQARLVVMDTMNFWITSKRDVLTDVIRRVDIVLMNEAEIRQYADTYSLIAAARQVLALGPRAVVVKKGEYGAVLFADGVYFVAPAYPIEDVRDPTGAGDSFAGGFVGFLARHGATTLSDDLLRRAVVHGSVAASFTVEDFSVGRLATLTIDEIRSRYREFRRFTTFEGDD